jgi:uncharacterized membrane protein
MLCAIGALLLFIPVVPGIGIVGIILLLIGMKGVSDFYKDPVIYSDAFKGVIFGIIGIIALSVLWVVGIFGGMLLGAFTLGIGAAIGAIALIAISLVVAFVFYLLMALNFRKAFNALEQRSGQHLFHTAGTLLWIGAILTIIIVGAFLVWIAWLIAAIAFFSMNFGTPQQSYQQQPYGYQAPPPPPAPSASAGRFCPNCGAPVDRNATFCPNCGKQLPPA